MRHTLIATLLVPLGVLAQENTTAPTPLSPIQVTAARSSEAQLDAPQPVTVLTREQIEREAPQVMTELLRGQPGAYVQQTGPGQGIVIVRGLKGAEVLHLVDGMRLNNAFFRTAPSQYIALVDPYNIAQLELLRGPYGALYGPDAMGGVVQVLTPEERFSGAQVSFRGTALARYGSASLAKTGRAAGAVGNEDFSVAGGFTFLDYGSRRLGAPGQSPTGSGTTLEAERVAGTGYLARGYDFKTLWTPNAAQELMFSAQFFELPGLPRYNELSAGFDNDGVPGPEFVESIYANDRAFYHLRYRYSAPLAFMDSLEIHLGEQVVNDDRRDRATATPGTRVEEANRSTLDGLSAQASSTAGAHGLSYGVELYRDRVDSRRRDTNLASGAVTQNGRTVGVKSRFPDGARSDNLGAWMFDEWTLAPALTLDGGLRYTYTRTELPQADRALPGSEVDDHSFTGNLGMAWRFADSLAWTLNAGTGLRAPNVNDLAQVGRRSGNRITIANPDLKPEQITSLDTGLKFGGARLIGEGSVFYSRYRERIALVPTGNTIASGSSGCNQAAGCVEVQNRNIAKAEYYGFEGGLRWNALAPLSLYATLNYTWGEQEDRGLKSPGNRVPPLNGQIGAEWRASTGLRVEPYVYFAAQQTRPTAPTIASTRTARPASRSRTCA